jgi:hypothetical protein
VLARRPGLPRFYDGAVRVHLWERELRAHCESQFDFLVSEHSCRRRGRFISGGWEVFYWNSVAGVRILVQYRDPFTVDLCPIPEGRFPPRADEFGARQRIEWFDAFDVVTLVSGRSPQFTDRQLYGNDPAVIADYAEAVRGPCQSLLRGDPALWAKVRAQR